MFATFFDEELARRATSPANFLSAAQKLIGTIIGPAFIGYADESSFRPVDSDARILGPSDEAAVDELMAACPSLNWEHGGSLVAEQPTAGIFVESHLVALADDEIWGGSIAHIAVITDPAFRGRGLGRCVVSAIARHAFAAGLIPNIEPCSQTCHRCGWPTRWGSSPSASRSPSGFPPWISFMSQESQLAYGEARGFLAAFAQINSHGDLSCTFEFDLIARGPDIDRGGCADPGLMPPVPSRILSPDLFPHPGPFGNRRPADRSRDKPDKIVDLIRRLRAHPALGYPWFRFLVPATGRAVSVTDLAWSHCCD